MAWLENIRMKTEIIIRFRGLITLLGILFSLLKMPLKNKVFINQLIIIELTRRDDIISMIYLLIYLYEGKLPWVSIKGEHIFTAIGNMKI